MKTCDFFRHREHYGPDTGAVRDAVEESDYCVCYINHTWGSTNKLACMAKRRRGLQGFNLGSAAIN